VCSRGGVLAMLMLLHVEWAAAIESRGPMVPVWVKAHDQEQPFALYQQSHALLIGNSDYADDAGYGDLLTIPEELDQVAVVLEQQGFSVTRANNLTYRNFKKTVEEFFFAHGYNKENRLLLFYSGHGETVDNRGYLIPVNGVSWLQAKQNQREEDFFRSAISMEQIKTWTHDIQAKHMLVLFDACFSGTIFQTRSAQEKPNYISSAVKEKVREYITAGGANEPVPAKSAFVLAFIDGLRYGKADLYPDGYITGSELGIYLRSEVSRGGLQHPEYGKDNEYPYSRGDFIFSLQKKSEVTVSTQPPVEAEQLFSIDTLVAESIEAARIKTQWSEQLEQMENALGIVEQFVLGKGEPAHKIAAWTQFIEAPQHQQENPFSERDEEVRKRAREQIVHWSQKDIEQQSVPPQQHPQQSKHPAEPKLIQVEGGSFIMGDRWGDGYPNEKPLQTITIKPFMLGRYEVTQVKWSALMDSNPSHFKGCSQCPVEMVNRIDVEQFLRKLNQVTGKQYRLPTEMEWEYAARSAGQKEKYSGASRPQSVAWFKRNAEGRTHPVGQKQKNQLGFFDMSGNVNEWTCTPYKRRGAKAAKKCLLAENSPMVSVRGGSWSNYPRDLRTSYRARRKSSVRNNSIGFRVAHDVEMQP
jgi:formylglycine-generating enzyme required for sulfatase activity